MFLVLIIFAFLFLLSLGIAVISYFLSPSPNPYVVYGLWTGNVAAQIAQDPTKTSSVYIQRSNNQDSGLEFTWSTWMYINDIPDVNTSGGLDTIKQKYQHVFNKGFYNGKYNSDGTAAINNCPGLYIEGNTDSTSTTPNDGVLHLVMDTIDPTDKTGVIDINNIPLQKWFHVVIRVKNTILDVYINGVIAQRKVLTNLPRQNYEDLFLCQNGGFSGSLSNMRYYQYALNVFEINNIISYGPNLNLANGNSTPNYNYLSKSWYYYNKDE